MEAGSTFVKDLAWAAGSSVLKSSSGEGRRNTLGDNGRADVRGASGNTHLSGEEEMKPSRVFSLILILVILVSVTSLFQGSEPAGAESEQDGHVYLPLVTNPLTPIIPDTTVVLTDESTEHLASVSNDLSTFTFSQITPELAGLDVGDVMVGDASAAAPHGFLRQVTNVATPGGQVVVTTEQATLEDAIDQGSLSFSKTFTPADLQSWEVQPGVTLMTTPEQIEAERFTFRECLKT